jgi:hypothetical protein
MERRQWKTNEERQLREMYALGKSCHEIAEVLNRTHASVESRASRMRLKRPADVVVERYKPIRKKTAKRRCTTTEFIDCMPNPFERLGKKYGFDNNFYRH